MNDDTGIGELVAQWNDPLPLRQELLEDGPEQASKLRGPVAIVSQWRDRTRLEGETTCSDPGPDYAVLDPLLTLPGELCQQTRESEYPYVVVVNPPKEAHHGSD